MATYNAYVGSITGNDTGDGDASTVVTLGLQFYVTQANCTVTQVHFYQPSGGSVNTSDRVARIYSTSDSLSGTLVGGPYTITTTAGSGWKTATLATPVALTANTRYVVAITHRNPPLGYSGTANYFTSGAGSTDRVVGPLTIPSNANVTNNRQGSYVYAEDFPNETFNGAIYWADVTIDDNASTTPSASGTDSWNFAGSGVGKKTPKGSGTDSWNFAGSGTGKKTSNASGTDSWNFAGSGVGKRVAKASGTDSWDFAGSGAGKRIAKATGTGSWNFAGSGIGSAPSTIPKGSGIDSWNFAGAGVGKRVPVASGVDSWNFAGSGVGAVPSTAGTSTGGSIIIIGNKVGFIF